jgi:hypothetical protein
MIDIPMGKALVAVKGACINCFFFGVGWCNKTIACESHAREDGKNVIFKLINLPEDNSKHES